MAIDNYIRGKLEWSLNEPILHAVSKPKISRGSFATVARSETFKTENGFRIHSDPVPGQLLPLLLRHQLHTPLIKVPLECIANYVHHVDLIGFSLAYGH